LIAVLAADNAQRPLPAAGKGQTAVYARQRPRQREDSYDNHKAFKVGQSGRLRIIVV